MKMTTALITGLLFATIVCASNVLTVNADSLETSYTNDQSFSIDGAPETLAEGQVAVFKTSMTFTLPTEAPDYSEAVANGDKLVIVCDEEGKILIANSSGWTETGTTVTAGTTLPIIVVIKRASTTHLGFDVYFNEAETPIKVTSPNEGLSFGTLVFEGEGSASNLSVAVAPTSLLPGDADEAQDPATVYAYLEWVNGAGKYFNGVTEEDKADAFAMNVGGKPKLEITSIDLANKKITVKGSYTTGNGDEATADLSTINGMLYITYASTLSGGDAKVLSKEEYNLSFEDDGIAIISIPKDAKFIKASVALKTPEEEL